MARHSKDIQYYRMEDENEDAFFIDGVRVRVGFYEELNRADDDEGCELSVICYSIDRPDKGYQKPKPRRNDARRKAHPPRLSGEEQLSLLERYCKRIGGRNQGFLEPQIFHDAEEAAWTDFSKRPAGGELMRRFNHGDILCVTQLSDVFFSVRDAEAFFHRMAGMQAEIRLVNCWPEGPSIAARAKLLDTGSREFMFLAQLVSDLRKIDKGTRVETALRGWVGRRTRESVSTIPIDNVRS